MARLPDQALVVLVGPSGSGKSTWAQARYRAEEVVSSDALRGVVGSGAHDLDASAAECRRRNNVRDRPVPASVLTQQLARHRAAGATLPDEGWDVVEVVSEASRVPDAGPEAVQRHTTPSPERRSSQGLRIVLQLSRFPWGEDPVGWLTEVAMAADAAGLVSIALQGGIETS